MTTHSLARPRPLACLRLTTSIIAPSPKEGTKDIIFTAAYELPIFATRPDLLSQRHALCFCFIRCHRPPQQPWYLVRNATLPEASPAACLSDPTTGTLSTLFPRLPLRLPIFFHNIITFALPRSEPLFQLSLSDYSRSLITSYHFCLLDSWNTGKAALVLSADQQSLSPPPPSVASHLSR